MRRILVVVLVLLCAGGVASARTGSMYSPYEFNSLGGLVVNSGTVNIYTGSSNPGVVPTITVNGQVYSGNTDTQTAVINGKTYSANVAIFSFDQLSVGSGVTISVSGSRALSLLSRGNMTLQSNLDMGSVGYSDYGVGRQGDHDGGGGGAYGGDGGFGYSSSYGVLWPGAAKYGEASLASVLLGGSRGGNAWPPPGWPPGGLGGGALQLVSAGTLSVESRVSANGQRGTDGFWAAAGGSGGGILMVAPTLSFGTSAQVQANGAAPGNGMNTGTHGGGGRIAMYYESILGFNSNMASVAAPWTAQSGTVYHQNSLPVNIVPEPSSLLALAGGLGCFGTLLKRRR